MSGPTESVPREPSVIDQIAESYLADQAVQDPLFATEVGVPGHDHLLTDFSPAACTARTVSARATVHALAESHPVDDVDRVTVATMTASLRREIALAESGERVGECNVIASPLQAVRDIFDLMPTESAAQREVFLHRLRVVPECVDTIIDGLRHRIAHGPPLVQRQVELVAAQAATAADAIAANTGPLAEDASLRDGLDVAQRDVRVAFEALDAVLRAEAAPVATDVDAVGRERYIRFLPAYLGADVDPDEAYAWATDRLSAIVTEQAALADEVLPGASVAEAMAHLDSLPRYAVHDRHEFVAWMQELSDRAVEGLAGTHFDIPAKLTRLECRLAPSSTGIIYYTQPSADLSRPGRMWWSVPPEQKVFHTWQEKTTVFHEGVPGHHLQLGAAIVSDELNAWRKLASFTSGHGEGWALYAERLMAELGWLDDPGDRMGMLDSQRLRAARVVVDIGVHCKLRAPAALGGGTWDAEKAWQFLTDSVAMDRAVLRFELNRYLGWPGQAPSYALGQRVWEETRTAALATHRDWTLKDFHTRALALGGVSLDVLAGELTST
ncbi:DUF885 family protein [Gordonia sp. HNM0687]|uniref:DUF885 family protein n=1 Tax=Gordonia mangrovi TaxID=2665643 RepID=A0A6L7GQV4_9ACTN|nr:DUF885 domain-containing protein [Gordonia mangrovi]MXP22266.1 DUF885 family protein [Gordonia mangrovi]UVF77836.1 DUF885 domain-containing protein [Gordonia mangrovi]